MLVSPSCIFDPKENEEIKVDPPVEWPDRTSRDDVIEIVVLSYQEQNRDPDQAISKYRDVLHSQYFFRLHPDDVEPGGSQIMPRLEDEASTEWIFGNETMLELEITDVGAWDPIAEVEGEPCENCWETTRQYYVQAQFGDETTIFQSPPERAFVTIIAAPDENDPENKWVLRAMFDLGI
jgi:hypothetical protein